MCILPDAVYGLPYLNIDEMGMDSFKIIIVEDVKLELKGTEEIIRTELPEAEIIGTAMNEGEFWCLIKKEVPDLLLLDLGLGGSTTIGVEHLQTSPVDLSGITYPDFYGRNTERTLVGRCIESWSKRHYPENR